MALSTPGYWTFTAATPAVGQDGAVHLADRRGRDRARLASRGRGVAGGAPSSSTTTCSARLGRHRRHVGLQRGQRRLRLGRQALGDERDHLARLHDGALHVAELPGDVLGGPDGEALLEPRPFLLAWPGRPRMRITAKWSTAPGGEAPHPCGPAEPLAAVVVVQQSLPDRHGCRGRHAGEERDRDAGAGHAALTLLGLDLVSDAEPGGRHHRQPLVADRLVGRPRTGRTCRRRDAGAPARRRPARPRPVRGSRSPSRARTCPTRRRRCAG